MRSQLQHLLLFCIAGIATASFKIPFLSRKKQYTPLVFFTVPKDLVPACDEMEKVVSEVERELGVHVERLDVVRDPAAETTLSALTNRGPPYLYNKESCQVVHVPKSDASAVTTNPVIDKERVRAWAKGRFLVPKSAKSGSMRVLSQQDNSLDQKDLVEDMSLTDMQKSGKEAIKKRTEEKSKEKQES
eukprot:CAMPEP_0113631000 /NCGR_PEP_ID=MMETSP0017_2-20120614/16110_1 /TAXON_ID=2856 /ORGANISM="Cylindrotheca closterium" /LENGTH=187 /DNA_ID=CAMNT_0000541493 /DNA_START=15 /DNA_END=578 /DNA_ORIENTATION=- /assembly_acc=CAM_ASM_000147